jgi:hypothetical protein
MQRDAHEVRAHDHADHHLDDLKMARREACRDRITTAGRFERAKQSKRRLRMLRCVMLCVV